MLGFCHFWYFLFSLASISWTIKSSVSINTFWNLYHVIKLGTPVSTVTMLVRQWQSIKLPNYLLSFCSMTAYSFYCCSHKLTNVFKSQKYKWLLRTSRHQMTVWRRLVFKARRMENTTNDQHVVKNMVPVNLSRIMVGITIEFLTTVFT